MAVVVTALLVLGLAQPAAAPADFGVSVSPQTARPGDRISVVVFPRSEDVRIVGCLVFFRDRGVECRQSGGRWLAEVRVPATAKPGPNTVRWGVLARTAAGRRIAQNNELRYTVLPKAPSPATSATAGTTAQSEARAARPDRWRRIAGVAGPALMGLALLIALFAFDGVRSRVRGLFKGARS
ncbi:hypothetical protein [Actinoplanes sp. URMC 104]|uniref:hypothetical protein n=1 Tax=Actinoplanes sp. URMC 104 TaxID=3423409 RepID=UPI003F1992BC